MVTIGFNSVLNRYAFIELIGVLTARSGSYPLIYFRCPLWQFRKYSAFFKFLTTLYRVHDRWFYSLCSLPACVFYPVLGRLTAFKLFVVSHYVYNLFSVEIYKLHGVSQFFIVPLISWETVLICYFYLKLVKPFTVRCKRWGVFIEIGWLALLSFYPSHIPRGKPTWSSHSFMLFWLSGILLSLTAISSRFVLIFKDSSEGFLLYSFHMFPVFIDSFSRMPIR